MRCSHCGICCEKTEMLLSNADIERLEELGYSRKRFVRHDRHGFARLRNRRGVCVFYDIGKCRCKIYRHRPVGCRIYPVMYSEQERVVVVDLCPMRRTVSKIELRRKGRKVVELLRKLDNEAHARMVKTICRAK